MVISVNAVRLGESPKIRSISRRANFDACEPMGAEPLGDGLVSAAGELFAELIRSQPA